MADRDTAAGLDEAGRTLIIERVFKVFKAWTDPAVLVTWWGPAGFTTPECRLDPRAGSAWRTVMRAPDGSQHAVSGIYRAIEPPCRLVITWAWEEDDGSRGRETEVEVTFAPTGDGTRMRLVQRLFPSQAMRDRHEDGWSQSLGKLARLFA